MSTQTLTEPSAPPGPAGPPARVVLKIGTSSLVTAGRLDPEKVATLARTVRRGIAAGLAPVLVTSGAIALGRPRHPALAAGGGAGTVDADTAQQVAFALGQGELYGQLQAEFGRHGLVTGQLLLTPYELTEPGRGAAVRRTLDTMLGLGMVPLANENDALGVRNNDVLAALLSGFIGARLLLLLTNVPGLYDADRRPVRTVPRLSPLVEALAGGAGADGGTGGMRVKLAACWIATYSGVRAVIADTADPDVLAAAVTGTGPGTHFEPLPDGERPGGERPDLGALWRAFRTPPAGALTLTAAGERALAAREPIAEHHIAHRVMHHVTHGAGQPRPGDVVDLLAGDGRTVLARGPLAATHPGTPAEYVLIVEGTPCR